MGVAGFKRQELHEARSERSRYGIRARHALHSMHRQTQKCETPMYVTHRLCLLHATQELTFVAQKAPVRVRCIITIPIGKVYQDPWPSASERALLTLPSRALY